MEGGLFSNLSAQEAVIGGVILLVIKDFLLSPKKELKTLEQTVTKLSLALTELTVRLKFLETKTEELPEIKKDLNNLGNKVRGFERDL